MFEFGSCFHSFISIDVICSVHFSVAFILVFCFRCFKPFFSIPISYRIKLLTFYVENRWTRYIISEVSVCLWFWFSVRTSVFDVGATDFNQLAIVSIRCFGKFTVFWRISRECKETNNEQVRIKNIQKSIYSKEIWSRTIQSVEDRGRERERDS